MEEIHHRSPLRKTRQALQSGKLTVGFIGGSITDERPGCNWPEPVTAWLVETFPGARIQVENVGIGATGSDLAVFRAERDLIRRGCDLVFIEFAVNDAGEPTDKRMRTREGLLRKLKSGLGADLVFVYTYQQTMYAEMQRGEMPASIAEFEQLAEYYQIGSVWMGLHALREVQAGHMRWEEWLPDGLHPQQRGSLSYGQVVAAYLQPELCGPAPEPAAGALLPAPLHPANWEHAFSLPFEQVQLAGPWVVKRWVRHAWLDYVLQTAAPGARLSFDFTGRGLQLGFDFGKSSAEFRYRIDGGAWLTSQRDRPDWCGVEGWFRPILLADDLPLAGHHFELEVTHANPNGDQALGPRVTGTTFNLGLIGIIA